MRNVVVTKPFNARGLRGDRTRPNHLQKAGNRATNYVLQLGETRL
jgi:hypothetical protein